MNAHTTRRKARPVSTLTLTSAATISVDVDTYSVVHVTAQSTAMTGVVVTGTPVDGQSLRFVIKDDGARHSWYWGASFPDVSTQGVPSQTSGLVGVVDWVYDASSAGFILVYNSM